METDDIGFITYMRAKKKDLKGEPQPMQKKLFLGGSLSFVPFMVASLH